MGMTPAEVEYKKMLKESNMSRNSTIKEGSLVQTLGNKSPKKTKGKLKA